MGAIRPTSTVDIVRAIGIVDEDLSGSRENLDHVRDVICGLRDQVKEAVTMATEHLTSRLFWRDGERWLIEGGEFIPGVPIHYEVRMTERFPNLERLWIDSHEPEVMAAKAFAARFPGRKLRF